MIDAPIGLKAFGDTVYVLKGDFGAADGRANGRTGHMRQRVEIGMLIDRVGRIRSTAGMYIGPDAQKTSVKQGGSL